MSRSSRELTFFLTGAIVGAAVGLLYAPQQGKVTRDKLTYQLSKYRGQLNQVINDLISSAELPENVQRNEGQRVVNDAREKAERLLEDVDRLMAQIKQQNG